MNVGEHCQLSDCKQIDFLPFKCSDCGLTFCSDHRHPINHSCTRQQQQQQKVSASPNRGEQASHSKDSRQPRCPVPECKTIITVVNEFVCPTCKLRVCLAHRYEDAHPCKNSKKQSSNQFNQKLIQAENKQQLQQQLDAKQSNKKSKSSFFCCFSNAKPSVKHAPQKK